MYYLLFYKTADDYLEKRGAYRAEHLGLAQEAQDRGEIVLAGAFANPADGALLVFKGDSPAVAEAFARNDPYVKNGLIVEWWVREWTVVIGAA
ncbi:MAG: YciI family protein [Saprospirales bacterium]|nr:YciI family protein [Saprospirales bacterium]MBK8490871.1 YciI family protein [Saprospirales bacterium]